MNILLINHYAGSTLLGMEYRPYYLAREWTKKGHNVTIVASSFSHLRSKQPEVKTNFEIQIIDGIRYVWIKTMEYEGNSVKRFINILEFVVRLFFKSKVIAKSFSPDVVIASSTYPLDIYPARRIAKSSKAKLIYEIHDLWPLSPMELGGYSKYHPFIMLMQAAENFCYRKSDLVVSLLPKTKEHCVSHGLIPNKWHYVPNGINIMEMSSQTLIPMHQKNTIETIKSKFDYVVGYTGSIGLANSLSSFVYAAKHFSQENVAFVIIGKGPEKNNLIKIVTEYDINNVFFIDSIPKDSIQLMLDYFDFLFIGLQKQNLFRFGISPNKLFDYMYAGKPSILAIDAGNDIVSEAECGITIEPENSEAIEKAVIQLINSTEEEKREMGQNGKEYVLKNHDYRIIADKFLELM